MDCPNAPFKLIIIFRHPPEGEKRCLTIQAWEPGDCSRFLNFQNGDKKEIPSGVRPKGVIVTKLKSHGQLRTGKNDLPPEEFS